MSVATVSRALNGFKSVDPTLEARVLQAVRELGYRRDGLARGLRRQVNTILGVLVPDIENPFFNAVVRGAEDTAYAAGYLLIMCNTDESTEKESAYLDVLLGQNVAGLLFVPADEQASDIGPLLEWGMRVVAVDRRTQRSRIDAVLVDNVAGAQMGTQHLIDQGHRRIATVAGPERTTTGAERLEGFRRALLAAGIPAEHDLVARGDFHVEGGYEAATRLCELEDPPEAVFVANNLMAVGAIQAFTDHDLRIGSDIAMVCFDELPAGTHAKDLVTTVRQPAYEIGRVASEILLRRINGDTLPVTEVRLDPSLHDPRSSVTPSASRPLRDRVAG